MRWVDVNSLLSGSRPKTTDNPDDSFEGRAINILVVGSDHRSDEEYDENGQLVTGMRSDTTMLMHISKDRSRVSIISIPRDTLVYRPECKLSNGDVIPATSYKVMFNDAFSVAGADNDVAAAAACTLRTLEDLTDVYLEEFVVVDFDGFKNMIAALGGVKMCLKEPVKDYYGVVDLPAGCQTLGPDEALGYARARHLEGTDGSDLSRIGRQQELMGAIFKESMSKNILTDMPTLYSFLKASLGSLTTSPDLGSVTAMGGLAYSISGIDPQQIRFYTMPNEFAPEDPNRVIPTEAAEKIWKALRYDDPIPKSIPYTDLSGKRHGEPTLDTPDSGSNSQDLGSSSEPSAQSEEPSSNLGDVQPEQPIPDQSADTSSNE